MRIVVDGAADAVAQMQRDHERWEHAARVGVVTAELRLFTFAPAGITLGASQRPEQELDLSRCAQDGVRWAVRPTGGRALFHAEEWTFALLAPLGPHGWARDAREAYQRTCEWFAAALVRLGVPVSLAPGTRRGVGAPRGSGTAAPPCFASSARHELLLDGRKFAGVAQRVDRGRVLQQGSLLLGPGHERLADYLALPSAQRDAVRDALRASSATAGAWLGPAARIEHLADALARTAEAHVRPNVTASVPARLTAWTAAPMLSPPLP